MKKFLNAAKSRWMLAAIALGTATLVFPAKGDDWPEFRGGGRQGIWKESGLVGAFEGPVLERLWSAPIGAGYSGPTVAGDRVYVMDRESRQVGTRPGSATRGPEAGNERIVCLDRKTGKQLWAHAYPCRYVDVGYPLGPRASVTVAEGRAYALGTMGDFRCLDAATGEVIWKKNFREEYDVDIPIWGLTNSPLVEGDRVIMQIAAGAEGACVVALEKDTGAEAWRAFADKASYVSPIMIEQAGVRVLVVWTGFRIAGMNPATGAVHWEYPTKPHRMPINVPGPAIDETGEHLFLTTFYDGSRMLKLSRDELSVEELWFRKGVSETKTDALHAMISPPYLRGGHVYGVDSYGQLRCLRMTDGERVWESIGVAVPEGRWSTIFMVPQGERTWMFNELGELILARLTPEGFDEIGRAKVLEPTTPLKRRGQNVVWSQPAFAHRCIFARNDEELVCASLAAE